MKISIYQRWYAWVVLSCAGRERPDFFLDISFSRGDWLVGKFAGAFFDSAAFSEGLLVYLGCENHTVCFWAKRGVSGSSIIKVLLSFRETEASYGIALCSSTCPRIVLERAVICSRIMLCKGSWMG